MAGVTLPSLASRSQPLVALFAIALPLASLGCGCNPRATDPPPDGTAARSADGTPNGSVAGAPEAVASSAFDLPMVTMPAAELGVDGFKHVEVLRIRRDWGKREFEIVMDAWVPDDDPTRVETVRLWWFKTNKNGERGPFSAKTKRHFDIVYSRPDDARWKVEMVADDQRYTFMVEADEEEGATAFGTVVLPGGKRVDGCRVRGGEIHASKVFGLPTGIKDFQVKCTGRDGAEHEGDLAP